MLSALPPLPTLPPSASRSTPAAGAELDERAGVHNSKAVLQALRTLQDKLRKLEAERDELADQCERAVRALEQERDGFQRQAAAAAAAASARAGEQGASLKQAEAERGAAELRAVRAEERCQVLLPCQLARRATSAHAPTRSHAASRAATRAAVTGA